MAIMSFEALRRLQLCGYKPQRGYFKLFVTPYFLLLCVVQCACVACEMACVHAVWSMFACASGTLAVAVKKRKCPLRFTKRMCRIVAVHTLLCVGESAVAMPFVACLPLSVLVAWAFCLPVDCLVARHYLRAASDKLQKSGVTVIAVTGSYGKTGVTQMLAALLDCAVAPKGSCNTPLGIAAFINGTDLSDVKYLVLEFGARKMNDIAELCRVYPPSHGVITGVCAQHLSTFGSLENIIKAKQELVCALPEQGYCVLNANDNVVSSWTDVGECRKRLSCADVSISCVSCGLDGTTLTVKVGEMCDTVKLPQICAYACDTFEMCAELCTLLGRELSVTVKNAQKIRQIKHRAECTFNGRFYVIDDSYNANIVGIRSICATLSGIKCKKVSISQGIVECGGQCAELNRECGSLLGRCFDAVIVLGKNAEYLLDGLMGERCVCFKEKDLAHATNRAVQMLGYKDVLYFQNDLPDVGVI